MASLQPKTDKLGKRLAAHLLRRTTFYITPARILEFADKTHQQAITELTTKAPFYEPKGSVSTSGDIWLTSSTGTRDPHGCYRKSDVLLCHDN